LSEAEKGPRKIKVVDRRRFDERGDLRPDRPETKPSKPPQRGAETADSAAGATADGAGPAAAGGPGKSRPDGVASSPLFLDLVAVLAQQAELLLTGAEGLPAQPAEAQRVIEYLGMLESKTAGNLSPEESQVLSNVIFQLRSLFLQQRP
jgi:hypothetical protein